MESAAAFGKWLADQEYRFDEMGEQAWLLDVMGNYLAEGVGQDSEDRCLSTEHMKQSLQLMQHAPRLLRFVLRGLELLSSHSMSPAAKNEALLLLLQEVAQNSIGPFKWRDVARAVERQQASA